MIGIYGSVLVASLLGSLHCAGMCGPLAAFCGSSDAGGRRAMRETVYHGARLVAYATLGAIAGGLGKGLDDAGVWVGLNNVAAAVAGATMLLWGGALLLGGSTHLGAGAKAPLGIGIDTRTGVARRLGDLLASVMRRMRNRPPVARAALIGLGSALLPCGWLYAFVLVAGGTGGVPTGAATMVAFWLGTVPALAGVSSIARALARRLGERLRPLGAAALLIVGVTTVVVRMNMPAPAGEATSRAEVPTEAPCHGH